MTKSSKSQSGKNGSATNGARGTLKKARPRLPKLRKDQIQKPRILDETEEEREKRLAKRAALTLRAFQMAYDSYHRR